MSKRMHAWPPGTGLIAAITMSAAVAAAVPVTALQDVARELAVDYERSMLVAKTGKAGLLRFLGHEHGIVPGSWSAQVRFDPEDLAGSRSTASSGRSPSTPTWSPMARAG